MSTIPDSAQFEPSDGGLGADAQHAHGPVGTFVVVKQANDDTEDYQSGNAWPFAIAPPSLL